MGYKMNMGSKEKNDPINFSQKDQSTIKKSPAVKKHEPGTSYGYKSKKGGVRGGFNKAFKRAKKGGYDTFSFGYDKNNDGTISFQQGEVKRYSTKTK